MPSCHSGLRFASPLDRFKEIEQIGGFRSGRDSIVDFANDEHSRGGLSFIREFRFLAPIRFVLRGDRRDHPPFGFEGGSPGAPSAHILIRADGMEQGLPTMPMESFTARTGDIFRLVGAGGGGYGDALQRDAIRVEDDLREGKVTSEGATRDYGVVFAADGVTIDHDATIRRRAALVEART